MGDFQCAWREEMRSAAIAFPDDDVFANLRDNTSGREVEL